MIKFFRKIRYELMEQNKTGKYFKYAIGEVILVVIGILIALQINNWNASKKDRTFELKMLKEISKALDSDINYIKDHLIGYRTKEGEKSLSYFKKLLKKEHVDMDSLDYYFGWTNLGILLQVNEGPYQGLKSLGLDKISNDTIRNKIQYLYDFLVPRQIGLTDLVDKRYEKQQTPIKELFIGETEYTIENDSVVFKTPLREGKFWDTPEFIQYLSLTQSRLAYRRTRLDRFTKILEEEKKVIDTEIKTLSN